MDTESGPPPEAESQSLEPRPGDKPVPAELKPRPQENSAVSPPVDESREIDKARGKIAELSEEKKGEANNGNNKTASVSRKTSIIGDDPYPYIPVVRDEETDNTPIAAEQDFKPEDFGHDYFHGTGMGSNYGKLRNGYKAYDNDHFWNSVVRAVRKYLPANAARVLEVGCAEGYLVKRLQQAGFKEVIGLDISSTVLEEAKENVPTARFEEVNLNRDNFNPNLIGTFDAITAMDVLEHTAHRIVADGTDISGPAHVIPKLVSLLKKDGVFMMSVPVDDKNIVSRIFNFFDSDKTHISKLSSEGYLKILEENGLEVMEKRYLFLLPWFRIPYLHTALEVVCKKK